MGWLTTFTLYNDSSHKTLGDANAKHLCRKLDSHICRGEGFVDGSDVIMQRTRHADDHTIYVHMGNTVSEMSAYSQDTEARMREHPEFFENMLEYMAREVKNLKKTYARVKKEKEAK
ncbi:hypothetical protein HN747_03720 [archaeon]|jgi:hypothetical protein|nr:hypothetical protein [archaeon]